jgi:hypothetical protein
MIGGIDRHGNGASGASELEQAIKSRPVTYGARQLTEVSRPLGTTVCAIASERGQS